MTLSRTVAGVMVAGFIAVTAGSIWAARRQAGPRPGPGTQMGMPMRPGALSQLSLTTAQREQIKAITERHRADIQPLAQRARTARAALLTAETAVPLDDNAVRARAAELAAVQEDLAVARAHLQAEVFQVFTPEQQQQVRDRLTQALTRRARGRAI